MAARAGASIHCLMASKVSTPSPRREGNGPASEPGGSLMEMRVFGRTGLRVSLLGFGCGAVGGLMVRGSAAEQAKAVGRALAELKPAAAIVGTKVRLRSGDFGRIAETVSRSLDGSLQRLQRDQVEIFHLHNPITVSGGG